MSMPWCPLCGGQDCPHWVGWTEDGRHVITPAPSPERQVVRDGDLTVQTGASVRVYRPAAGESVSDDEAAAHRASLEGALAAERVPPF